MLAEVQSSSHSKSQEQYLKIIKNSSRFLNVTINDILDYVQIKQHKLKLNKTCFSVFEFFSDLYSMFQFLAHEKGIQLRFLNNSSVTHIYNDKDRFYRILTNLIQNAIKFTQVGSVSVTIDWDFDEETLLISVEDTGTGIAN